MRVRVTSTHLQPYGAERARPARSSANEQACEDKRVEVLQWQLRAEENSVTDVAHSAEAGMTQARMYGCTLTEGVVSWAMLPTAKDKCMWWARRPGTLAPWVRLPQQRRNERLPTTSWGGGRLRSNRSSGSNSDGVRALGGGVSSGEWWRQIVRPRPCQREEGSWGCQEGR